MADLFSSESAQISPFSFGGHEVRVVMRDGEPWFVAGDVCAALDYRNTSKAVADHLDDDERMTVATSESHLGADIRAVASTDTPVGKRGGARFFVVINESGLYALVLRSRKPEARKFAKWVTSEVLPSIRKTGAYGASDPARLRMAFNLAQEAVKHVALSVFQAALTDERQDYEHQYLLRFGRDHVTGEYDRPHVKQLERGALLFTTEELIARLRGESPGEWLPSDIQLSAIVSAGAARLQQRAEFRAEQAAREASQRARHTGRLATV